MKIIHRSCESALRNAAHPRRTINGSNRAFSHSAPSQRGTLPTFSEPSSPELSNILSHLNTKILFPAHLTHDQRLLIYKARYRSRIEADPIYVSLGTHELPLEHLDRTTEQKSRWEVIKTVTEKAETLEDWDNAIRVLEGFRNAGIRLKTEHLVKFVRKANEKGVQGVVLKALQRVQETGLTLREPRVLEMVLRGVHDKGSRSGWDREQTRKALGLAEDVVLLMEKKEHLGSGYVLSGDPRASPLVIALPLELAAVRAARHLGGEDADGKVAKYALRLMTAFKQDNYMEQTLPDVLAKTLKPELTEASSKKDRYQALQEVKNNIPNWVPVWHALETASSVLGAEMPHAKDAQKIAGLIKQHLQQTEATVRNLESSDVDADALPCVRALREVGL